MTDFSPITPPPELVREWSKGCSPYDVPADHIATQAACWGANQELEACCAHIHTIHGKDRADWLRFMRRPKPPSLAEESLALIDKIQGNKKMWQLEELDVVRRALERLQELENND